MRTHTVVVLITVAMLGVSSIAMAKGGGGGGGGGRSGSAVSHGHFGHFGGHFPNGRHFQNFQHFPRNQLFLGGGWGWDSGYPGYGGNTSVLVSQQSVPGFPAADITGSVVPPPCHWNEETFSVPSSAGGKRPVQVVSCR